MPEDGNSSNGNGSTEGAPAGGQTQQGGQQNAGQSSGANGSDANTDWRDRARTWEQRANSDKAGRDAEKARADSLAAELDKLKAQSMSDTEKAIAAAKAEGAKAATDELASRYGKRLVTATARSVLAGRVDDAQAEALLEVVDHNAFLRKDGEPDEAAIKTWADRVAPARQRVPDLGQGRGRGGTASGADINSMIRRGAGRAH